MADVPEPKNAIEFTIAWQSDPENQRRMDAGDPTIAREFDLAMHRFQRDHPEPPLPPKPPASPAPAKPSTGPSRFERQLEAERCMGWLSYPKWQKEGGGDYNRLHPAARDAFIRQYEFMIADIVDDAVDPMKEYGLDKQGAIARLKALAAPFVEAHEAFKRNPPKMPPEVEAHYRKLFPWFFA